MQVDGDYERDGYVLVRGLIAPEVARTLLERIQLEVEGHGRSLASFAAPNPLLRKAAVEISGHFHPPLLAFLWGLTPIVSHLTGRELLPSYDYFRMYAQGDICRVHADRPSCEHSMSLTLAYSDGQPWPLDIEEAATDELTPLAEDFGDDPFASLPMAPGDAVLYRGVRHRHGRVLPNPNRWSAHLFLHWVERDGEHRAHAFDAHRIAEQTGRVAAG